MGRRLEQGREDEPYASQLRAATHHVASHELLVRGVEDSDVNVRLAAVGRGHRPLEAKPSGAIRPHAATAPRAVTVRACLPKNDECPSHGRAIRCPKNTSFEDMADADLRATRCRQAAQLERTSSIALGRSAHSGCP